MAHKRRMLCYYSPHRDVEYKGLVQLPKMSQLFENGVRIILLGCDVLNWLRSSDTSHSCHVIRIEEGGGEGSEVLHTVVVVVRGSSSSMMLQRSCCKVFVRFPFGK